MKEDFNHPLTIDKLKFIIIGIFLNHIEHIWDELGRTVNIMKWSDIPVKHLKRLVPSMPWRQTAIMWVGGGGGGGGRMGLGVGDTQRCVKQYNQSITYKKSA